MVGNERSTREENKGKEMERERVQNKGGRVREESKRKRKEGIWKGLEGNIPLRQDKKKSE